VPVRGQPWWLRCVRLDFYPPGQRKLILAFDLADSSTNFKKGALEEADVYFQRSYHPPDVERLPEPYRRKILPWGLNYACRSLRSAFSVLRAGVTEAVFDVDDNASRRRVLPTVVGYFRLNSPKRFFYPASKPKEKLVVFQTRVWTTSGRGTDGDQGVNELRAEMVRLLRKEFGKRFVGGLVPNEMARKYYPDLLARQSGQQSAYVRLLRRSLVGVYTRGLHHSTAWKLPEYLSSTMCVVSEPIRNRLQDPVQAGRHYLEYTTPHDCVDACVRIFEDRHMETWLRENAEAYYQRSIEPTRHMERCLDAAETFVTA